MKQKLLIIYNQEPFSIRDGVTAALNSLMNLMITIYIEVDLFIIDDNNIYRDVNIDSNNYNIRSINPEGIKFNTYSIIVVSPITTFMKIKKFLPKSRKFKLITQISDCIVYELWVSFLLSLKFRNLKISSLLKIPYYLYYEFIVNRESDVVILQTERDVDIFNSLYSSKKCISIPNIVFKKPIKLKKVGEKNMYIGWCATFKGDYFYLAKWFCQNVIVPFMGKNEYVKISFLGSGNIEFVEYIKNKFPEFSERFISNNFVEDIQQYYASHMLIVSPIYKGYGLINKTIDAMSSGKIVLGDKTAFNGISGVLNEVNCLIAESPDDFIQSLEKVFNNFSKNDIFNMGNKASQLISDQFILEKNIKKIRQVFKDINT